MVFIHCTAINELWKIVKEEKENGEYLKRGPKKMNTNNKPKKKYTNESDDIYIKSQSTCFIEVANNDESTPNVIEETMD